MNVLITGGKGFIAKSIKEYLDKRYVYNVFAPSSQELNLIDEPAVDKYILSHNIDLIIHTANKGGGRDSIDFKNVTEYNLRMFFNIAKHEKNVQKIISFGSGAEYGKHKPIIEAKEETYLNSFPIDEYGFYKSVTSRYIEKSDKMFQLRIFGCYGEYENYRYKFITNAIVKNLLKLPIIINRNVYFDYIYIEDLLKMVDWVIHNNPKEKIYNITKGEKIDLITLAKLINETSDYKSEMIVLNKELNHEYTSSNKKIVAEIGNIDFTPHKDAIIKIRQFFSDHFESLDKQTILDDTYLKEIDRMWKDKNE